MRMRTPQSAHTPAARVKMAGAGGRSFGADYPQQPPRAPDDVELKNIIDKLANFVARNGPEFEQMTMNKQRDNPKFQFLFGGEWHAYYKWRVVTEQQVGFQPPPAPGGGGAQIPPLIRPLMSVGGYPQLPPNAPPPFPPAALFRGGPPPPGFPPGFPPPNMPPPPLLPPSGHTPSSTQQQPQSLIPNPTPWQQQHQQAPPPNSQAPPTGPTHQLQLVCQELQKEIETYGVTDPVEMEFGSVVKRLMESCTKDSIASGKGWIFAHTHQPDECAKVAKFLLRKTLDGPGVGYNEKLHIIYLINDVIHQCARKGAQDLLQAIEDLVVQMVYNVYSTTSPGNTDSLVKVMRLWERQKYFADSVLQQIQAVVTGGQMVREMEGGGGGEPRKQQQAPWEQSQQPRPPWEQSAPPSNQQPLPWQQPTQQSEQQKPPWQQDQQVVPPWQQDTPKPPTLPPWQQQSQQNPWDKQPESNNPPVLPWQQHRAPPPWPDGPRPPPWGAPLGVPPPPWHHGPPPVGEPTPLFPSSKPGEHPPLPPASQAGHHLSSEEVDTDLPPHESERSNVAPGGDAEGNGANAALPPRSESSPDRDPRSLPPLDDDDDDERGPPDAPPEGPPRRPPVESFDYQHGHQFGQGFREHFHDDRPPPPREVFDYNHRPPHWGDLPPPPPPPHLPPVGPRMHFDSWAPPPPPDLPPPIPYYDLPAGLMVAVVPLFEHSYRALDPRDIRLPPPQPPSERLLQAVEDFYNPASDDKPRNEEGWEARALLDFFEAKHRAKSSSRYRPMRRPLPRRPRSRSRSRSHSRSPPPRKRRSRSYSRSRSRSRSRPPRSKSHSRSPSRRMYSDEKVRSPSPSRSRSRSPRPSRQRRSRSRSPFILIAEDRPLPPPPAGPAHPETKLGDGNVGHQLLKKMGWEEGLGLGAREQGIQEPIKGGEVRDKNNKYKGVGMNMQDPFELFRKNKSYTFNRSRAPPSPP